MICGPLSIMFGLVFGFMALLLRLALWMIGAVVVALDLGAALITFILDIIGTCCGMAIGSAETTKPTVTKTKVKYVPGGLSKRERKAIEKSVEREIRMAQDEMDMLMMMEVFADD